MASLFTIVCFLFLVMETLIGMVANGSIVLINFIEWFRRGKLSLTDLILTCLGLSRLLRQAVVILAFTPFFLLNYPISNNTLLTIRGISRFTEAVNLWFAACLSVFYLAKIAIFSHPVFLQLRRRFSGLVPWLLLGSVVLSAVTTGIVITSWNYGLLACNPYKSFLSNRNNTEMGRPPVCARIVVLIYVFSLIPFMVFLSSSILLISSLWKHVRRVKSNGTSTRDLNTQAHLSAIKALVSFAVLYLISFAVAASQSVLFLNNQPTSVMMLYTMRAVYPCGHAVILILINPKLKQVWVRMVLHFKCHLSEVPL